MSRWLVQQDHVSRWSADGSPSRLVRARTGSINSLIFTKLTEVFAAMVDAATLAGNWIVVDRTDGSGSATAELLLEMALQRGTSSPTILVIDSLERLGNAAAGSRSQAIIQQLGSLFSAAVGGDYSTLSQDPNGGEQRVRICVHSDSRVHAFNAPAERCIVSVWCQGGRPTSPSTSCTTSMTLAPRAKSSQRCARPCLAPAWCAVRLLRVSCACIARIAGVTHMLRYGARSCSLQAADAKLPFPVLADHKRKSHNNTCDPNRKWRYFYIDGIFRSATHIVLKNNDIDSFNVEEIGSLGFLYAHGDSRTYKRLRANIQQGKPIVMLHNSGGVVTAFSWLQRVMAHMRPPPMVSELQGPLRFLIANLSKANWTFDFGVPEIIMMRSLAERAPMLFRKNIVSVDILTRSEEEMLEVITGCFAQAGGVPELGLGNAEVNAIFTAWWMHLTLCENAQRHHLFSVIAQWFLWLASIAATTAAILNSSFASGIIAMYLGLQPFPDAAAAPEEAEPPHLAAEEGEEAPAGCPDARRLMQWAPHTLAAHFGRSLAIDDDDVSEINKYLNYAVTILPVVLALGITIAGRMAWRDKWSVCTMCADTILAEIYKFRMQTCEYDQNKPPGKDSDGNDLPPLTQKEKSRRARMLFVERVQAFQSACFTELSQTTALKLTRILRSKKVAPTASLIARATSEEKPTLAQWYKLKCHIEQHCCAHECSNGRIDASLSDTSRLPSASV